MDKFFIAMLIFIFMAVAGANWFKTDQCSVRWEGEINDAFRTMVEQDLAKDCPVLRVDLNSPGGEVINTLQITHEMREAKTHTIIEIHGGAEIASGATFIMANGSRGHRFARVNSLALVHGIQIGSIMGSACAEGDNETDMGKGIGQLRKVMATEYAIATGKLYSETFNWMACNNTQAGGGELLVSLGIADHVED
jgi:ATP-dependent protease ClpP protease subunit